MLADLIAAVFPEISIREWLRIGQALQDPTRSLGAQLAGAYRVHTLLGAFGLHPPEGDDFGYHMNYLGAPKDRLQHAMLQCWLRWLGRYLLLGDRVRLALASRVTIPLPTGTSVVDRYMEEAAYQRASRYFMPPWPDGADADSRRDPDFNPFHGWRVGEASHPGPPRHREARQNRTQDTAAEGKSANQGSPTHQRSHDPMASRRIGEADHPGPPPADWNEMSGDPWEAGEPTDTTRRPAEALAARIPNPGVQWAQKRVSSAFLDISHWVA